MKLLIVDDSRAMRMLVRRALRQAGLGHHQIEEAGDGVEALALIESWKPDLVLSDWNMPNMDGINLLKQLRAQSNPVRFGFVTSGGTPDKVKIATDNGALFLISKPFDPDTFESVITPALS